MANSEPFRIPADCYIDGTLVPKSLTIPGGTIEDADVKAGAAISDTKIVHKFTPEHRQASGTDVVTAEAVVHVVRSVNGGTLREVVIVTDAIPAGGDKQYTVDVHVGNASTAFATVFSGVITVNSSSAARTVYPATLTSNALAQNDLVKVIVTASGSTGTQGQGLIVQARIAENG